MRPARVDDPFARVAAARADVSPPAGKVTTSPPLPVSSPAASAAAGLSTQAEPTVERTLPDLALEETERPAAVLRPHPEPAVASRDPGLVEFGDVDLSGPDPFGDARRNAFASGPWSDPAPSSPQVDDPLAGLTMTDLAAPAATLPPTRLPEAEEAPPLAAPATPLNGESTVTQAPPTPPAQPAPATAAAEPESDAAADAEHSRKRLRSVGFNALSVVALVVLAVALFEVWKGRQQAARVDGGGPAAATGVSSAPYVTASGKPVVVVRGRVTVAEPVRRITVRAELLDGGHPVAAGSCVAGAVATVEEIHAVSTVADAEALAREVARRAPASLSAGEDVPFAAVIADPPANLRGADVRVSLVTER